MSTITREFTKEQLQQIIETDHVQCGEASSLARIALASLEAEKEYKHHSIIAEQLDHVLSSMDATDHQRAVISCAVDRLNNVSQLLQASPSALLVPETLDYQGAKELFNYLMNEEETNATVNGWNACRAAMLQGADRPQNETQNIPENIPATQFKPVADLYGLTSPTGSETSFTFDAVEARDFIDGGWSCQEYVELGRFQEAITNHTEDKLAMVDHSGGSNNMVEPVTTANKLPANVIYALEKALQAMSFMGDTLNAMDAVCEEDVEYVTPAFEAVRAALNCNSPVIPDGWVACVERMPSAGEQVLAYRPDAPESNDPLIKMATYVGGSAHGHGFDCYCKPTHWMPLPAAPQQEA